MKQAMLIEITSGMGQEEMLEDRSENLMDARAIWNVSFQIASQEQERCVAAERVTRVNPQDQVFSPAAMRRWFNTRRNRGRKRWWSDLIAKVSQATAPDTLPDSPIWRLAGCPHFWKDLHGKYIDLDDVCLFIEYDASIQHGYALVVVDNYNYRLLRYIALGFLRMSNWYEAVKTPISITDEEFQLLCNHW